jgi:hypothetical protein
VCELEWDLLCVAAALTVGLLTLCIFIFFFTLLALVQLSFLHCLLVRGEISDEQMPPFAQPHRRSDGAGPARAAAAVSAGNTAVPADHTPSQLYLAPFSLHSNAGTNPRPPIAGLNSAVWQWLRDADLEQMQRRDEQITAAAALSASASSAAALADSAAAVPDATLLSAAPSGSLVAPAPAADVAASELALAAAPPSRAVTPARRSRPPGSGGGTHHRRPPRPPPLPPLPLPVLSQESSIN